MADQFPAAIVDDLTSRAFGALAAFRREDEPGFTALIDGDEEAILLILVGLLHGWLSQAVGDETIDAEIDGYFHRRATEEYPRW